MTTQILHVIPAAKCDTKTRSVVSPRVNIRRPIASALVQKLSSMLRSANRQKQDRMVQQLRAAGITNVDGWTVQTMITGRLDASTGDRVLPDGATARRNPTSGADGRYYGSRTYAPVTDLHQVGVCWQPAS